MSFSGRPTLTVQHPLVNDGFWPDLDVAEFQQGYRMPAEFLEATLIDGIALAMGEVNLDLAGRKCAWQNAGIENVETADPMVLPERTFFAASYKRAVYCRAKAQLLSHFVTFIRRDAAQNLAKDGPESRDQLMTFSQQAVRVIQGRSRITAELI